MSKAPSQPEQASRELCRCAGSYKIPTTGDIPCDLRVTLLEDVPGAEVKRPKNLVHSSKNTGEAPLFLGASAFFALKEVHLMRGQGRQACKRLLLWLMSRRQAAVCWPACVCAFQDTWHVETPGTWYLPLQCDSHAGQAASALLSEG